jgi:hypothetical protein
MRLSGERVLLVGFIFFGAGAGIVLAFVSLTGTAPAASLTDTTTEPTTTTFAPAPDPAPRPATAPAPKPTWVPTKQAPAPIYHAPVSAHISTTPPVTPSIHARPAQGGARATSIAQPARPQRLHRARHVKRVLPRRMTMPTKSPAATELGVARARAERIAARASPTGGNAAIVIPLALFIFGVLLVAIGMVGPARAVPFIAPGLTVERMDFVFLGLGLSVASVVGVLISLSMGGQ